MKIVAKDVAQAGCDYGKDESRDGNSFQPLLHRCLLECLKSLRLRSPMLAAIPRFDFLISFRGSNLVLNGKFAILRLLCE